MSRSRIALTVAAAATGLLALGGTALATTSAPAAPTAVTSPASDDHGGALETELEHGRVVVKPHGGVAPTTVPSAAAAPSDDRSGHSGSGRSGDDGGHGSGRYGSDDGPGHG